MSADRLDDALSRILRAATDASAFVDGPSKEQFLGDRRTQQAVVPSLLVIGETATRILDRHAEFAAAHPEIPWASIRGMRNRIAHGYYELDLAIVWETVLTAVPELLRAIRLVGPEKASTCDRPT